MDLIDWLQARQAEQRLSLRRFAAFLHTSAPRLSPLLSRQRNANEADLGRIVRAYPGECREITALWESYREAWARSTRETA